MIMTSLVMTRLLEISVPFWVWHGVHCDVASLGGSVGAPTPRGDDVTSATSASLACASWDGDKVSLLVILDAGACAKTESCTCVESSDLTASLLELPCKSVPGRVAGLELGATENCLESQAWSARSAGMPFCQLTDLYLWEKMKALQDKDAI